MCCRAKTVGGEIDAAVYKYCGFSLTLTLCKHRTQMPFFERLNEEVFLVRAWVSRCCGGWQAQAAAGTGHGCESQSTLDAVAAFAGGLRRATAPSSLKMEHTNCTWCCTACWRWCC
jgi:hypothetical protein